MVNGHIDCLADIAGKLSDREVHQYHDLQYYQVQQQLQQGQIKGPRTPQETARAFPMAPAHRAGPEQEANGSVAPAKGGTKRGAAKQLAKSPKKTAPDPDKPKRPRGRPRIHPRPETITLEPEGSPPAHNATAQKVRASLLCRPANACTCASCLQCLSFFAIFLFVSFRALLAVSAWRIIRH
jgi:hypothetical protein